jgi:hypothetical protein
VLNLRKVSTLNDKSERRGLNNQQPLLKTSWEGFFICLESCLLNSHS